MQLAELILAISAWCGNLDVAASGGNHDSYNYSKRLNQSVVSCKKEVLSCLQSLKPNQAKEAIECFAKTSLPY